MVEKCLAILRTDFDFVAEGNDRQTPAMHVGLAKRPILFRDTLYFE